MDTCTINMDARGVVVLPAWLRKQMGLDGASLWLLNVVDGAVVLRPALAVAAERYTPERKAEFILNNAIDPADYARAVERVRSMGLDPASIPHERPREHSPRVP